MECYSCKSLGHYATDCPKKGKTDSISLVDKTFEVYRLGTEVVKINNILLPAVFGGGTCEFIVTSKLLKKPINTTTRHVKKTFKLIDGSTIEINHMVELHIEYRNQSFNEEFYIVENEIDKQILLGNTHSWKLRETKKMFIECCINTKDHPPISWSRPIRTLQDKRDFQDLI